MAATRDRTMLPLHSLLNPTSSEPPTPYSRASSPKIPSPSPPGSDITAPSSVSVGHMTLNSENILDEASILAKVKPRGTVNFPPFENLDKASLREVLRFKVSPFGRIHQNFHHIPYSSSKKDLFEKTGRESIEAFRYEFRVPDRDDVFVVLWDYNIGIVRMNPFIKWGQFPKTKSSQLLDKNPGLRAISPGITGGSVLAQGYWVPYRCARALFATFCHPIAGAMIPLFGPSFPSECVHPESADYGVVTISRLLIQEVSREFELSRRYYVEKAVAAASQDIMSYPRQTQSMVRDDMLPSYARLPHLLPMVYDTENRRQATLEQITLNPRPRSPLKLPTRIHDYSIPEVSNQFSAINRSTPTHDHQQADADEPSSSYRARNCTSSTTNSQTLFTPAWTPKPKRQKLEMAHDVPFSNRDQGGQRGNLTLPNTILGHTCHDQEHKETRQLSSSIHGDTGARMTLSTRTSKTSPSSQHAAAMALMMMRKEE